MRRAIRRSFGAVATLTAIVAVAGPAGAASSPQSGWWTSLPAAVAPDAPADGLVVQGGADATQPVAYAAVSYELSAGESATALKLTLAPSSGSNSSAALQACPLTSGFSPAQGGASSSGPSFDCTTKAAAKVDGSTFTFDVGPLVRDGVLAVAIVGTTPGDRVVFSRPGADALATTTTAAPAPAAGTTDAAPTFDTTAGTTDLPVASAAPTFDVPAAPAPDVPAVPAGTATTTSVAAPNRTLTAQPITTSRGGRSLRPFVFGALALGAAACWLLAGRRDATPDDPAWN